MKKWPLVIAIIYAVVLLLLFVPLSQVSFAFPKEKKVDLDLNDLYFVFLWVALFFLAQYLFLKGQVEIVNKRPVTKRTVFLPLISSSLCMGLLLYGVFLTAGEVLYGAKSLEISGWACFFIAVISWAAWAFVFYRWSKKLDPKNLIEKQFSFLYKGSILELLIAVPTHVVIRSRDYCCAGMMTFFGITFGLAVMLFAFGPAVVFLYAERRQRIRPNRR